MWLGAESNRRHVDFQSTALPTELPSRFTKSTVTGYLQNRGRSLCKFLVVEQATLGGDAPAFQFHRSVDESSRQFYCTPQKSKIVIPRNLDPAKLLQVRRKPLGIEQREFSRAQMFHQRHERNLGCVSFAMKHRFTKKSAADRDSIKSSSEFAFSPSFDGMGITQLVQSSVALHNFTVDPGIFTFRAALDYLRKTSVDLNFEKLFSQDAPQCVWHMKMFQGNDRAWIGREPPDRIVFHRHRKNAEPITLQ
jgi:hypothetical protein